MTMGLVIGALRTRRAKVAGPSPRPSPTFACGARERETLGAAVARLPSPAAKPWEREGPAQREGVRARFLAHTGAPRNGRTWRFLVNL
jgi:hypothetical protein